MRFIKYALFFYFIIYKKKCVVLVGITTRKSYNPFFELRVSNTSVYSSSISIRDMRKCYDRGKNQYYDRGNKVMHCKQVVERSDRDIKKIQVLNLNALNINQNAPPWFWF